MAEATSEEHSIGMDRVVGKLKEVAGDALGRGDLGDEGRLQQQRADATEEARDAAADAQRQAERSELDAERQQLDAERARLNAEEANASTGAAAARIDESEQARVEREAAERQQRIEQEERARTEAIESERRHAAAGHHAAGLQAEQLEDAADQARDRADRIDPDRD